MPVFAHGEARLAFEDEGQGFPLLLLAPGGMRSRIEAWEKAAWNPRIALRGRHRLISMDQRNAGASTAPIRAVDTWATYTSDQLALMDHLGIDTFGVVGMCIGGPYILRLVAAAPQRVKMAVMAQPIGLADNRPVFEALFSGWADEIRGAHPEADDAAFEAFGRNMFGGDFMFGASRADVSGCHTPLLVLMGDDVYHPRAISREVASLAPRARLVEAWKHGEADDDIVAFLAERVATGR